MLRLISHVLTIRPSYRLGLSYSRSLSSHAPRSNLNQLFLQHVFASFDKQLALVEAVDAVCAPGWECDLWDQSLTFGSEFRFKMQVIGTESTSSNTWMWGWANRLSVPVDAALASEELLALGRQENIPELTQGILPITKEINGHNLMMIATGVCNGDAYYRGPHDDGAVFMLIRDEDFPRKPVSPAIRIYLVVTQATSALPISDQRAAFRHYVKYYCGRIEETDDTIRVEFDDKHGLEATFEPHCGNRVTSIRVVPT